MSAITAEQDTTLAERLLRSSVRHSYDPEVDIDWEAEPVPGLWWMQPERMSLYGTPLWDTLSEDQRIELSKHEAASIASVGWWFEVVLMQVLLKDVYRSDPRSPRTHFLLTEVADECRHSTMFGRAMGTLGVPAYGPRTRAERMGRITPAVVKGAASYAAILLGEEPVDRWQRDMIGDERLQPLIRMTSRIHVTEEARHVSFARDELEKALEGLSRTQLRWHQFITAQAAFTTMRSLVHPEVYAAVGIDPREGRHAALANPHYRETVAWMGEKVVPYLDSLGMIGDGRLRRLWHASFLLPKER